MSAKQQPGFFSAIYVPDRNVAVPNSQNTDKEQPTKKTSTFEALVKAFTRKDERPLQNNEPDGPGSLHLPPPDLTGLQFVEDTAREFQRMDDASIVTTVLARQKDDYLPDPGDDNDWELDLDSTSASHCEDTDSDGIIDENGVGIIWHTTRSDSHNDRETDQERDLDFLYVDVFSAEMYFRAMSLRAAGLASNKPILTTNSD